MAVWLIGIAWRQVAGVEPRKRGASERPSTSIGGAPSQSRKVGARSAWFTIWCSVTPFATSGPFTTSGTRIEPSNATPFAGFRPVASPWSEVTTM